MCSDGFEYDVRGRLISTLPGPIDIRNRASACIPLISRVSCCAMSAKGIDKVRYMYLMV